MMIDNMQEIINNIKVSPYYQNRNIVLYCGDCLEIMKEILDKSIDLILTDPPYNASNSNLKIFNYNTINEVWDKDFNILNYLDILFKKIKENGQSLFFCSYHILGDYLNYKKEKLQQIIHWEHINFIPSITKVYHPVIEYIIWFSRKNYYFNKKYKRKNIIKCEKYYVESGKIDHSSVKPLKLIRVLLNIHSIQNNLILDPFAGSGTTGIACMELNRKCILIEKEKKYCNIIIERCKQKEAELEKKFYIKEEDNLLFK